MNPWKIKLRSLARRIGVIGVIHLLRSRLWPADAYERRVHQALAGAVRPGDVVWDVGANVGVYTELFCAWVGKDGSVVAFEPFAESCAHIRERLPDCAWLRVENVALGEADAVGRLVISSDSVENHLATDSSADAARSVAVSICRGDTICARLGQTPNLVKVDVEGFEEEVLAGMAETLASPDLRSLLVEVHFSKLEQRGRAMAPVRIEKLLRSRGFKTSWVDASHLFATR